MAKIIFTFPGQGTQYPNMLADLPNREYYNSVCQQTLGKTLADLDDPEALKHSGAVQAAIFLSGVSHGEELIRSGICPSYVCGLSIGAFPAAVLSGALDFSAGLEMVYRRGHLMQSAFPTGYGLTAIVGLRYEKLKNICSSEDEVFIANFNSEDQFVIAGSDESMGNAARKAIEEGASKCVRIKISVPSHCVLLESAAKEFFKEFESVVIRKPRIGYVSSTNGRVFWDPMKIKDDLIFNMCRETHWRETMISCYQRGCRLAIELPPGESLTKLTKGVFEEGLTISCASLGLKEVFDQVHAWKSLQAH